MTKQLGGGGGSAAPEYTGAVVGWDGTDPRTVTSFPYIMPISEFHLGTPNSIGEVNKLSRCSQGAQSQYSATGGWHGGPAYRIRAPISNEGYAGLGSFVFSGAASNPAKIHIRQVIKMAAGYIADTSKLMYIKSFGAGMSEEKRLVPWWFGASSDGGGSYYNGSRLDWGSGGHSQLGFRNFKLGQSYAGSPNYTNIPWSIEVMLDLSVSPRRCQTWLYTTNGGVFTTDTNEATFWPNIGDTSPGYYGDSFASAFADSDFVTMIEGQYWWTDGLTFPLSLTSADDQYITDLQIHNQYIGPPTAFVS